MKNIVSKILRKVKQGFQRSPNAFLNDISGVIHVGANSGQERDLYKSRRLKVIWIEPIPNVYEQLEKNLQNFQNQIPLKALVTDKENKEYEFHIANNNGASSSIYNLKDHKDIWPDVTIEKSIKLKSTTLPSLLKKKSINPSDYEGLIMDTQGSELLVLKGSLPILSNFKYIKTEVADFEAYEGCCTLSQIDDFMKENGFEEYSRREFAQSKKGGKYFDVTYKKSS